MKKLLSALCTGIFGFPLGGSYRGTRLMRGRAKERGAFASPVCKGKNANKQTPLGERLPLIPRLRRYLPPRGKAWRSFRLPLGGERKAFSLSFTILSTKSSL